MLAIAQGVHTARAGDLTGEQIYRAKCASCHGSSGEGTAENYPKPLAGSRTVPQLARFIAKAMPEDAPGECVGEDADKVAAYIHNAFYAKGAQRTTTLPRIELARLTVMQYRNAVADLVSSFREANHVGEERGLRAEYFKSRRLGSNRDRVFERIDPEVQFDFGTEAPETEKFDPHEFSIRWEGSLLAPDTGEYEFIVRTEHAIRLWVNDPRTPLIDALVKSSNDREHRGTIYLLAGRAYPLRLEFAKAKQGVDDSKKQKVKPPSAPASISLLWQRPRRPAEIIPRFALTPDRTRPTYALATPFPPDDRSLGYERGTAISKAWEQATTEGAIEAAGYVVGHLKELAGGSEDPSERAKRLREFSRKFVERAFRRPLTDEQAQLYIDRLFTGAPDPETGVKRVLLLALKSPRFLYREVEGKSDSYDVAARVAFGLWDALPDQTLLDAAASGQLTAREQVAAHVERMLADPRAHAKIRAFLLQWLKVDSVPDLAKDPARFPGFDAAVASDLRTSLELFLEDTVWSKESDFRQLLLSDSLFLNGRLARFYGVDLCPDSPFQKVVFEPKERAGVLAHPYLMTAFAYTGTSSPIHRGVFLARNVLGRTLRPPPDAFSPLAPELHPNLTTRERVALQTRPQACVACHGMINPLGFAMEQFDAVGRFRTQENGRPVDASGAYQARTGDTVTFAGVRDLGRFLASSEETHATFVERLFQYLVKQPIRAYGGGCADDLRRSFAENNFNIRKLVIDIVTTSALPGGKP
jgi:cytochrome c553